MSEEIPQITEVGSKATTSQAEYNTTKTFGESLKGTLSLKRNKKGNKSGHPALEDAKGQNYTFLSYMENKLEEKIEKKLSDSLSKAIQEDSREKAIEAQKLLRQRSFTLRVGEEKGWNVAAKIPKPYPSEDDEFKDLLVKTRKQARPQENQLVPYS
ncbi:12434_t:CDS:2 [Racocetra fulgida]|uniref:12434_t:CDS:1 n=1 Tax=Racocetra fulgida TaxID=60492 RepID=A0A9N9JF44_9GLOM|nr:12434_t:CDS:2 [Racocetra fulgida]